MVSYFVLTFNEKSDKTVSSILKEVFSINNRINYFITTTRQYEALCNKELNCKYRLDESKKPVLTCSEEQKLIDSVCKENDNCFCIVFTDIGKVTQSELLCIISEYSEVSLRDYKRVSSYKDMPFTTETNFRAGSQYNAILSSLSECCYKALQFDLWQMIKTIDNCMYYSLGQTYDNYLRDYREYLINYCEIKEQQVKKIDNTLPQIIKNIDNAEEIVQLKNELSKVLNSFCVYCDKKYRFKETAYLFHMLWNNLLINYGYEIVYSIVMSRAQRE